MKLLRHYLNVYGLIINRSHGCPTLSLLYAYSKLILKAHWVYRFKKAEVGPHTITLFGKRLFFPSYVFLLHQFEEIFVLDAYRSHKKPQPSSIIIDGGSHIGVSILYFITAYPGVRILSFEPDPNAFKLLEQFVYENNLTQVTLVNAALAPTAGAIPFYTHSETGRLDAGSFNSRTATIPLNVPAVVLTEYISGPIHLLKLDIEGAEVEVLKEVVAAGKVGAIQEIILEFHPAINSSPSPLIEFLAKAGFECKQQNSAALYETTYDYLLHFWRKP